MPIMQVQYPEAALDGDRKAALAQRLTDVLIAMEGGANTTGRTGVRLGAVYAGQAGRLVDWRSNGRPVRRIAW